MAIPRRSFEPGLGRAEIGLDPATKPIGLPEVEGSVGVPFFSQRPPDGDCAGIVRFLPGIDARFDRLGPQRGRKSHHQNCCCERTVTLPETHPKSLANWRFAGNKVVAVLTRF